MTVKATVNSSWWGAAKNQGKAPKLAQFILFLFLIGIFGVKIAGLRLKMFVNYWRQRYMYVMKVAESGFILKMY